MPTNIQNVSFTSPQALLAPDLSVEQQQAQRQSDLAAALRQMSLEPIDAGKGNIAWTQGAAKLAQALAGAITQRRADKQQMNLNQAFAGRMGSMFGTAGGGGQASGGGGAPSPPPSISPPQSASPAPPMTPSVLQPPPMRPQVDPLAALPDPNAPMPEQGAPMPQQAPMPPQPMPQQEPPQQAQRGPWSLSGDPRQDMSAYMLNPEEYGKAVIGNLGKGAAPTDVEVLQQHLQQAVSSGNMGAAQAIMAQLNKVNRLPMETTRPGAPFFDPNTGTWHFAPKLGEGEMPQMDANGTISSVSMLPGAVDAMRAKAQADAGGKAAFTPSQVLGPDNNYHTVPLTGVPGFGGGNTPNGPPGNAPGSLNAYYSNTGGGGQPASPGNISAPGPQGQKSGEFAGRNSANSFQEAIDNGAKAKDAIRSINLIMTAANGLPTGVGADRFSGIKSGINAAATGMGFKPPMDVSNIAKFDEIKKNVANLGAQLSSGAGQTGTDARLTNAIASLPSAHYSPAAIQEVGLNLKGLAAGANARSLAAANWQQQNGPGGYAQFQSTWQKAYNPDLFYHIQKDDMAAWAKGMSPTARARVLDQYRALKGLGAQF